MCTPEAEYVKLCKQQANNANSSACRTFMNQACDRANPRLSERPPIPSSSITACSSEASVPNINNAEGLCHYVANDFSDNSKHKCRDLVNQMCNSASDPSRMAPPGWGGEPWNFTDACAAQMV